MDNITIYLLIEWSGEYEAKTYFRGIFSSEEKACEAIDKMVKDSELCVRRTNLKIYKFTLDQIYY